MRNDFSGTSVKYQLMKLKEGCNILVATPGRYLHSNNCIRSCSWFADYETYTFLFCFVFGLLLDQRSHPSYAGMRWTRRQIIIIICLRLDRIVIGSLRLHRHHQVNPSCQFSFLGFSTSSERGTSPSTISSFLFWMKLTACSKNLVQ